MSQESENKENRKESFSKILVLMSLSFALLSATMSRHSELKQLILEESQKLNITPFLNDSLLVFNRVPKVGSQTINRLISELRSRNNFSGYTSVEGMPFWDDGEYTYMEDREERRQMIFAVMKTGGAFLKHLNFLDFSEFDPKVVNPIYINFVRDPVERIISWYYYIRSPTYQFDEDEKRNTTNFKPAISIRQMKTSLEDCIEAGLPECRWIKGAPIHSSYHGGAHSSQMSFFCGHVPQCNRHDTEANFKLAMANVDKYFAVIGVLEDWSKSLQVLESFIPKYFAGSVEIYESGVFDQFTNKNMFKPKVSNHIRKIIAQNFTKEIEFYHYCRQRLHKQYLSIL